VFSTIPGVATIYRLGATKCWLLQTHTEYHDGLIHI